MSRILALLVILAGVAHADPVVIRLAGVAPDGASWTRELKAFGRDVEGKTEGRVKIKWYWGGVAGDELEVLERIRRGQLDGQAGAQFCDRLAPSLRVLRVLGLVQGYDEAAHVIRKLTGALDKEFRASGFIGFASTMGSDILFTRQPVRTMADFRRLKPWLWNLDELVATQLRAIGVKPVLLPILEAAKAYDDKRTDGFVAIPQGALGFQWSAQARFYTDLHLSFLPGCLVMANRTFDALKTDDQKSIREAVAKLLIRFEDLGKTQDAALLSGLFARQGTQPVPPDATFRAEFLSAAIDARKAIPASLVAPELITRVQSWLADYRGEHAGAARR